ncbi:MAG: Lrp/AsnC family transcriptional regulator, partial [Planctomycetota bacterium]
MSRQLLSLDDLDRKILLRLMEDGRITWAQLAADVGLSAPSITERVRKLERLGVIEGYGARVNPEVVGYGLLAFVSVGLTDPNHHAEMLRRAETSPEIQEYHIVAGDYDYLLKLRCRD